MTAISLLDQLDALPEPLDAERVDLGLDRYRDRLGFIDDEELKARAAGVLDDARGRDLLATLFGFSPYLTHCVLNDLPFFLDIVDDGPDAAFDAVRAAFAEMVRTPAGEKTVAAQLRRLKRRASLLIAIGDIAAGWPVAKVTRALSLTAEDALEAALAHLLREAAERGRIELADPERPQADCGLFVLGMGKLGAYELNYSSDIDLIVLFDLERVRYRGDGSPHETMVRLTRDLVRLIDARTEEGYVFRTDLRLRPDPGSTPLALSTTAAEVYYESVGQNWERAAMIKARPVAGDRKAGEAFMAYLTPFVWRKSLDFYAIADIHSIKRQINAHRGSHDLVVPGHNLKVGRGGIREIEFFCQTQQLIFGGREPGLRKRATCDALDALVASGRVEAATAADMAEAYRFLRKVEHRLQMIEDAQTHSLPKDEHPLSIVARFSGFADRESFERAVLEQLTTVERHYGELFEDSPDLGHTGNLVFTGSDDDPDTLATLRSLGFREPERVSAVVREWHRGRVRATRSQRARELLTELMPSLLEQLGETADPDAAFVKFNEFLTNLPAGVQVFSLFHSNPELLDLVAEIMGSAPRLAERLSRRPLLLEGVLDLDFFEPLPDEAALEADLEQMLAQARDYEDVLELSRRWVNDRKFQIGVQIMRNITDADAAAPALSAVADAVLKALLPRVEAEFAEAHGRIEGGGFAVLAFGRLGSGEMSVGSDLDLVFVYDTPDDSPGSDGRRALSPSVYYTRLSQRMISALTVLTGEGRLYEVDTRLRPQGNSGPMASRLDAWRRYYRENAWTWEHMALTRARVVACDDAALGKRAADAIRDILVMQRDPSALAKDAADMRQRIAAQKATDDPWQVKQVAGGLVDLEFLAQYLQIAHAHDKPQVLHPNAAQAFDAAASLGLVGEDTADILIEALALQRRLLGLLRLTVEGRFAPARAPVGLREAIARAVGVEDFDAVEPHLRAVQARVRGIFEQIIGPLR